MTLGKVLITGGAGFIGSNLANKLIEMGYEVFVVDDLSMGKKENLVSSNRIHFYEHTITDEEFIKSLLIRHEFDYMYLLAAIASVADTVDHPYTTHYINQDANLFILETIRENNLHPKRILFSSSAAVYGDDKALPKKESSVIMPLSPYAIDKYSTERFVINYRNLYGLNTVATRFFNVYGPHQNPQSPYSGVLSIITDRLQTGNDFILYGDGEQTRDFIYVDDVVRALLILAKEKSAIGHVYNVATGVSTRLKDVVSILEKISGKRINITCSEARKGDIKFSSADVGRIKRIGYTSRVSIEDGLKEYWNSLQEANSCGA